MEQAQNSASVAKKGSKKLIVFIILLVILAGIAGIFYYKYRNSQELGGLTPPKLFEKGDYKIVTGGDGYVVMVDKVGLTARVPDGWRAELEGNDMPDGTSQYWVNLLSPDAEKTSGLLTKGCGISILVGNNIEQDITNAVFNNKIDKIKEDRPDFSFDLVAIDARQALRSTSPTRKIFGKTVTINIPLTEKLIVIETRLPELNETICLSAWEDFLKTVDLQ